MDEHDDEREVIARLHELHRSVVRWLGSLILVAIISLTLLAIINASGPQFGVIIGAEEPQPGSAGESIAAARGGQADQAIAILGNIASAGIGGLVGWVTRDFTLRYRGVRLGTKDRDERGDDQ